MKIPFTFVRFFSRKNTPKRGRSGSVPKPKNKGKGVVFNQVVVVGGVIPVVAEYDLDKPSAEGYASAVEAVTNSLLEVRQIKSALELGDVLRFVRFTYRNRSIEALVNRKTVKEKFGIVADYLKKMESDTLAATRTPFLYASSSACTSGDSVSATRTPFLYASAFARTCGGSASATRTPYLYASASACTSGDFVTDLRAGCTSGDSVTDLGPRPLSRMASDFTPSTPMPPTAFARFLSNFNVGSVFRAVKQFPK